MLTHLQIRDFAIIDLIELEVRAGLTVLTGETGAGKSIVVDALALARRRQGRRRSRARRHRTRRAVRHLRHQRKSPAELRELLAEQSVEAEDELTVRRVIASDGRSRGYLNGRFGAAATLLRDVGALIVDIHGQHEFQSLTRSSAQRELLDDFGKNTRARGQRARGAQESGSRCVNRTVELEGKARDRDSRIELLRYQVSELKALDSQGRRSRAALPRSARAIRIAAGSPKPRRRRSACCTTPTKAMRTPRASRALAGIKTCRASIRGSPRSNPPIGC